MIWYHLYSTLSARDTGTLYQIRNLIDARNVTRDPANNYYAAKELLDKFRDAYLINGALYHFGMTTVDSEPTKNCYEGHQTTALARKSMFERVSEVLLTNMS